MFKNVLLNCSLDLSTNFPPKFKNSGVHIAKHHTYHRAPKQRLTSFSQLHTHSYTKNAKMVAKYNGNIKQYNRLQLFIFKKPEKIRKFIFVIDKMQAK